MAYFIKNLKKSEDKIDYLPYKWKLKNDTNIILMSYEAEKHEDQVYSLFQLILEEGNTYPQKEVETKEEFRSYFVSQNTFVCTLDDKETVIGAFYIKENFPGRSSHIANSGFIVNREIRNCGIGKFMAQAFLYLARDLGYKASFFNLVYETNERAVHLYKSLGYEITGKLPNAGYLNGYTNPISAYQFYYDFSKLQNDFVNFFHHQQIENSS